MRQITKFVSRIWPYISFFGPIWFILRNLAEFDHWIKYLKFKIVFFRLRGFWHLMMKWKGSVFKLIWHDLLIFVILYFLLGFIYRFVIFDYEIYREIFEVVCIYSSRLFRPLSYHVFHRFSLNRVNFLGQQFFSGSMDCLIFYTNLLNQVRKSSPKSFRRINISLTLTTVNVIFQSRIKVQ